MNYSKILNPFTYIAGTKTLLWGLAGILITSIFACFGPIHLDGVLDIHIGLNNYSTAGWSLQQNLIFLSEGVINWITISGVLYISSVILSKSKVRIVDVLGTQAFARLPLFLSVFIGAFTPLEKASAYFLHEFANMGNEVDINPFQLGLFILFMLSTIISIVWMVIWMYKAYAISANLKGTKAIVSFIVSILLSEIITKTVIFFLVSK
ncbi:MAG: hypothetical protein P4L28_10455 [Paludibacteraceae bacterium]|nr:hypothetical protein [Paludibacteraceae bacterium]